MKLLLIRKYRKTNYTIGALFVDGAFFCETLEDKVRDLAIEEKIPGKTAIPTGKYEVVVDFSPKFKRKLPHLLKVPFFEGIRIHRGNTPEDTAGCILVGENKIVGRVVNSTQYEFRLTQLIEQVESKGEKIILEIK